MIGKDLMPNDKDSTFMLRRAAAMNEWEEIRTRVLIDVHAGFPGQCFLDLGVNSEAINTYALTRMLQEMFIAARVVT
jgi:hypothetical protein